VKWTIWPFVAVFMALPLFAAEEEDKVPFSARLSAGKSEAEISEPLTIRLLIRNETAEPLLVFRSPRLVDRLLVNGRRVANIDTLHLPWERYRRESPPSFEEQVKRFLEIAPKSEAELVRWDLSQLFFTRLTGKNQHAYVSARPGRLILSYEGCLVKPRHIFGFTADEQSRLQSLIEAAVEGLLLPPLETIELVESEKTDTLQRMEAKCYIYAVMYAWSRRHHRAAPRFPDPDPRVVPGLLLLIRDDAAYKPDGELGWCDGAMSTLGWLGHHAREAVEPLAETVKKNKSIQTRTKAILALAWIGGENTPRRFHRKFHGEAQTRSGNQSTPPTLSKERRDVIAAAYTRALADDEPRVRSAALAALYIDSKNATRFEQQLLAGLHDREACVRLSALRLYLQSSPLDGRIAEVVLALLNDEDPTVTREALYLLCRRWCDETFEPSSNECSRLEGLLPRIVTLTAQNDASRDHQYRVPYLIEASGWRWSGNSSVLAWSIIERIRPSVTASLVRELEPIIREGGDPKRRLMAIRILDMCGVAAAPAAAALETAINTASEDVSFEAARVLSKVQPTSVDCRTRLFKALHDNSSLSNVLESLARLRPVEQNVIDTLRNYMKEKDSRDEAISAARFLGPAGKSLLSDIAQYWAAEIVTERLLYPVIYVRAVIAIDPGSEAAFRMYQDALASNLKAVRAELRSAVVLARGAEMLPGFFDDVDRRGKEDQALRLEAIAALSAMQKPEWACEAAAALIRHCRWLHEEAKRGVYRYVEKGRVEAALRALDPLARGRLLQIIQEDDALAGAMVLWYAVHRENFPAFRKVAEVAAQSEDPALQRAGRQALRRFAELPAPAADTPETPDG